MYTSGTTGTPKGAMISHANVMSAVGSALRCFTLSEIDVHVSYLPLAHIFETVVQIAILSVGGDIAFFQGDVKKLPDDFKDSKVTLMCGVPRVYERIYDRVQKRITENNCIKRWVANKAFAEQAEAIRTGSTLIVCVPSFALFHVVFLNSIVPSSSRSSSSARIASWDEKVFIPIRTLMGLQNVRVIVSGAAPMAAYLAEFLRV
jgi:long-chain acyl-CoA synthetase